MKMANRLDKTLKTTKPLLQLVQRAGLSQLDFTKEDIEMLPTLHFGHILVSFIVILTIV